MSEAVVTGIRVEGRTKSMMMYVGNTKYAVIEMVGNRRRGRRP
jgi:hypothetical protein